MPKRKLFCLLGSPTVHLPFDKKRETDVFSKASLISVDAAIVAFLQLCQYNIPFLTPTKMFWIHKLTYFFFIDVFHGIVVPLNMEVPWDLGRSFSSSFFYFFYFFLLLFSWAGLA